MDGTIVQTILIVDDDARIGSGVAAALERPGRQIIVCQDTESAQLVIELVRVDSIVTDMKFTGEFGFEGLDLIAAIKRLPDSPDMVLMTGHATETVRTEARSRGAKAVLQKPFATEDLEALLAPPDSEVEPRIIDVPLLDDVIGSRRLVPLFQPLISTAGNGVVGCEALTRLETDSILADPTVLFRYAAAKKRVVELETMTASLAIRAGRDLARFGFLSINAHPHAFHDGSRFPTELLQIIADASMHPGQIVVEITEQGPLPTDALQIERAFGELVAAGVRFAFDDVGSAFSHLRHIDVIRPAFLKISQHFGTNCEAHSTNRKIVENVCALASSLGSQVVLEGVETEATAEFARRAGIPVAQGYFYARPASVQTLTARLDQA
jgi:EAL domain-containing protein (putative c-di-GMP-specific phosphodiesterase class I)/ActR/RegA family two-component response regulator